MKMGCALENSNATLFVASGLFAIYTTSLSFTSHAGGIFSNPWKVHPGNVDLWIIGKAFLDFFL
ncbi:hypothetical protein OQX61_23050 [Pedobacter sp. PLR]|uniref:hypothetical protein n=1 Tax=Pedobacter sp. PLR TaxID=2994465 RepID=UPI0022454448|nr:hypothetical protein [Pedobacter sp. PLR]MCX2454167.1 hypothetical protein [Pedobacter sp. PLR]